MNGDNAVNILDFIYMNKVIAQEQNFVSEADINSDNICTADDLVLIKKYILGVWYPLYQN